MKDKEVSAREMFEKSGYIQDCDDEYAVNYFNNKKNLWVWFNKRYKTVETHDDINMQELQAINQQCKELGWFV